MSSGGGRIQIGAYGGEDKVLTGNPQITYFKSVYRRHTNFSIESVKQQFSGNPTFGEDVIAKIKGGDLLYKVYLEHDAVIQHSTSSSDADTNIHHVERYGDSLIRECKLEIGGQTIDTQHALWSRIYSDLTQFNPSGYFGGDFNVSGAASGNGTLHQLITGNGYGLSTTAFNNPKHHFGVGTSTVNGFSYVASDIYGGGGGKITIPKIFIPLNFWFCRNPGLALPLIGLQYHEVILKLSFEKLENLFRTISDSDPTYDRNPTLNKVSDNFTLWCDYVFLDKDERRRMSETSHEYLIEQVQRNVDTLDSSSQSIELNFKNPVKEIIWVVQHITPTGVGGRNQKFVGNSGPVRAGQGFGDPTSSPVSIDHMVGNWSLKMNGLDRFPERDSKYFTNTQVWQHHTGFGGLPTFGFDAVEQASDSSNPVECGYDSIAVYSFALNPEDHQPSGSCNFSRVDEVTLVGSSLQIPRHFGNNPHTLTDIGGTNSKNVRISIFAVSYNILRIMSGMGGLAYSE